MPVNEEFLMIYVQEHECLYNLQNKDYDNNPVRDNIWKDIANKLNSTPEECKNKWALLRSYYRRALSRRKTVSGQAAKNMKKWRFEDQMEFLRRHMQERKTCSNLNASEESEADDEVDDKQDIPQSSPSPALVVPTISSKKRKASEDTLQLSSPASVASTVSSRKRKASASSTQPALADALTNFIQVRTQSADSNNHVTIPSPKRKLMTFFEDISESILKFPEIDQAKIKRDIFNLVNSKEIVLLRTKEYIPPLFSPNSTHGGQQWVENIPSSDAGYTDSQHRSQPLPGSSNRIEDGYSRNFIDGRRQWVENIPSSDAGYTDSQHRSQPLPESSNRIEDGYTPNFIDGRRQWLQNLPSPDTGYTEPEHHAPSLPRTSNQTEDRY